MEYRVLEQFQVDIKEVPSRYDKHVFFSLNYSWQVYSEAKKKLKVKNINKIPKFEYWSCESGEK